MMICLAEDILPIEFAYEVGYFLFVNFFSTSK